MNLIIEENWSFHLLWNFYLYIAEPANYTPSFVVVPETVLIKFSEEVEISKTKEYK